MNKKAAADPRLAALRMLADVLDSGQNLGDSVFDKPPADSRDRAFARHLAYGVLRWLGALEWLAGQLLNKPLKAKDRDINRLILIGIYQLWKSGSAPHAAIHESAESARRLNKPWAVSLVNAILRRFQREQANLLSSLDCRDERLAHPRWLLDALQADWPQEWESIAAANNLPGALWLRLNRRFEDVETLDGLAGAGFEVALHPVVSGAVKVTPAAAVNRLPGFEEGRFSVQDPAAQLAAGLLQLEPGQRVLDACAAPGGKTGHILESGTDIAVTTIDLNRHRLEKVRENLQRLEPGQPERARLIVADAADTGSWWDGHSFDRILLDAPCSATGVIRRHPEIKWLRTPTQVAAAVDTQTRLLQQLWPVLTVGGILLYATCSVLKAENSRQIQHFLDGHGDAELLELPETWGREQSPGRQILPGEQEFDGFYYARLRKIS
jgi:16S rRNA (cytosine967-C5)-methyltransferase